MHLFKIMHKFKEFNQVSGSRKYQFQNKKSHNKINMDLSAIKQLEDKNLSKATTLIL